MFCRVCLQKTFNGFGIFASCGIERGAAEILAKHLWFQPKHDDPISTDICDKCWHIVQSFAEFFVRLEAAHKAFFANYVRKTDLHTEIEDYKSDDDDEHDEELAQNKPDEALPQLEMATVKTEVVDEQAYEGLGDADPLNVDCPRDEDIKVQDKPTKRARKAKLCITYKEDEVKRKKTKIAKSVPAASVGPAVEKIGLHDRIICERLKLSCDICQQEPGTLTQLLQHKSLVHAQENPYFICCKRKFTKRFNLVQHVKNKHSDNKGEQCHVCQKVVLHLKKHLLCAHLPEEELKFPCDKCGLKFSRGFLLKQHKSRNCIMEERTILCERCDRKFSNVYELRRHMTVHQVDGDAVPWDTSKCPKCPKVFSYPYQLRQHMSVHGEGPLKCDICKKGFSRTESLAKHKRAFHSADREAKRGKGRPKKEQSAANECASIQTEG